RLSSRVVAILTEAVGEQRLHFDWLPAELAVPTRRLATILVWGTALVMAAPYLPGSDSKAFIGICIMLGILVSLGSTSVTSNLLSGLVLTYARTYSKGDWVEIGDVVGDVVNLGPFTTRIRTIKDEEVIIPNAVVQAGSVRNFTRYAAGHGVQIHTEVTAGYDVPWRTMQRVLLEAAKATEGARSNPAPYVLARALDEHSVRYELYAYCDVPRELHLVEARMLQAILDTCAKEGVDIRAPHLRRAHEHAKAPPLAPPPEPQMLPSEVLHTAPPMPTPLVSAPPIPVVAPPPPSSKPPPLPSKPASLSIKPPASSVKAAASPSIKPPPVSVKGPVSVKPAPVAPISMKPPPVSTKPPSSIKPPPSDS
ncbi:MAG: mechanosensitive ion channel domain-containing protein, partial [Polyangiaceae bacterium]